MLNLIRRVLSVFIITSLILPPNLHAQEINLPVPGKMIELSASYMPVMVKGLMIHPDQPFKFDFLIDSGDSGLKGLAFKAESMKLIKYFLAALTVPEDQAWVNLSPYEKNRIISKSFGDTEMGRDLLAQDYILKQLTASLTYPEKEMGKEFWNKVYAQAQSKLGTTNIPVNTFNKVWIVPQQARVYEHGNGAFVVESRLKVMLEEDYLSLAKHTGVTGNNNTHSVASQVVREIVIPALEKEVNEGEHFANLRQIYNAVILATWYKIRLKDSILGKLYADQNKTQGVAQNDKQANERIYQQYLEAFKKGVYNYIKEDSGASGQEMPRKYFSGGATALGTEDLVRKSLDTPVDPNDVSAAMVSRGDEAMVTWQANTISTDEFIYRLSPALRQKEAESWSVNTLQAWKEKLRNPVNIFERRALQAVNRALAIREAESHANDILHINNFIHIDTADGIDAKLEEVFANGGKVFIHGDTGSKALLSIDAVRQYIENKLVVLLVPKVEEYSPKDVFLGLLPTVNDAAMAAQVSHLSPQALQVLESIRQRNPHVAKFVEEQAIMMGARDIEVIGQEDEPRLIQEGLAAGDLVQTVDGNYLGKSHPGDVQRVVERTMVATHNPKDKGKYNNWRDARYVLDMVMPKFENALKGTGKMYVVPYIMEPEGSNFDMPSIQVTNSAYVALQSITMAGVGEEAWRTLGKSEKFHKGIHFTGDLDNLRRDPQYRDEYDDRWFVSLPDEGYGMTISYGSNYGGNVLFGKKFEGLRLGSWMAAKDPAGKMAEHMALVEMINLQTGEKKYFAFAAPSNSGKTNFAMMKVPHVFADKYQMRVISDDLVKIRVGEDGRLYAFNPERGIFGVVTDTNERTNPNFWHSIGPNTGTIFTNMAYKLNTEGKAELWWKGKTKDFPEDITGWYDWTGKLISDRVVTQEAINEVAKKLKKYQGLTLDQLTSDELIDIKKRMATWEHPNGRATTKLKNVPSLSIEYNNPRGVPIDAFFFGGRVPTEGFVPPIRQLKDFNQGLYSLMTMFVSSTAAEAGAVGVKRRDPAAMLPFLSLHEIDYFKNWIKVKDLVESKGAKFPAFFQTNWFIQDENGNFMWPGYEDNMRLLDWAWRMLDGTAQFQKTPIGLLPDIRDINTHGMDISADTLKRLFTIYPELWKTEARESFDYLNSLADADHPLPQQFIDANKELRQSLGLPALDSAMTVQATSKMSIEDIIAYLDDQYGFDDLQIGPSEVQILRKYLEAKSDSPSFNEAKKLLLINTNMPPNLAEAILGTGEEMLRSSADPAMIVNQAKIQFRTKVLDLPRNEHFWGDRRAIETEFDGIDSIENLQAFLNRMHQKFDGRSGSQSLDGNAAAAQKIIIEIMSGLNSPVQTRSQKDYRDRYTAMSQAISQVDNASLATKGGIDLNAANLDLQIKRDDKGMPLPVQFQDLGQFKIDGLYPVILSIAPVTNLPELLGLTQKL